MLSRPVEDLVYRGDHHGPRKHATLADFEVLLG
jgi:hypothetical protein